MQFRFLIFLLFIGRCAHAQPESEYSGFMKHLSRSVSKRVCRNVITITRYSRITGKPDSLIFHRTDGEDKLVFQWNSEGYQALFTPAGQDSSFILRYNSYQHRWHWGCKSKFEFPLPTTGVSFLVTAPATFCSLVDHGTGTKGYYC